MEVKENMPPKDESKRLKITQNTLNRFFSSNKENIEHLRKEIENYGTKFVDSFDTIIRQLPILICQLWKEFDVQFNSPSANNESNNSRLLDIIHRDWRINFPTESNDATMMKKVKNIYSTAQTVSSSTGEVKLYPKAYYLPYEVIYPNRIIMEMHQHFEPFLSNISTQLWKLQTAIQLLMPMVEATNEHGVQVQKQMKQRIVSLQDSIHHLQLEDGGWQSYANKRIKCLQDYFLYFQVADCQLQLEEFELDALNSFKNKLNDIIMKLMLLQHELTLNLNTIKKPQISQEITENIVN